MCLIACLLCLDAAFECVWTVGCAWCKSFYPMPCGDAKSKSCRIRVSGAQIVLRRIMRICRPPPYLRMAWQWRCFTCGNLIVHQTFIRVCVDDNCTFLSLGPPPSPPITPPSPFQPLLRVKTCVLSCMNTYTFYVGGHMSLLFEDRSSSLLFEDRSTSTCGCCLTTFFCWASCLHVLLNKYIFMCVCVNTNCPMISFFKVWDHDFMSDTIFLLRVLILHASSCVCASVEFLCVCVYM